ncbi:MAG: creatininase family protein, partial [Alphaproteobacteria bacterium]|nr:creatininase family protein [Alphaproteobacteria bacterium]
MAQAWRNWLDLTTEEFRTLDPAKTVALLPVSAVEQHGPHLTVAVDQVLCEGIVARAAGMAGATPVVVLPQQDVGKSNEHLAYPGTLSFSAETLIRIWTELGECVHRAGLRKFEMYNSHGGHPQILGIEPRALRGPLGMTAVATPCGRAGMPQR